MLIYVHQKINVDLKKNVIIDGGIIILTLDMIILSIAKVFCSLP